MGELSEPIGLYTPTTGGHRLIRLVAITHEIQMQLSCPHHLFNSLFRQPHRRRLSDLARPKGLARIVMSAIALPRERIRSLRRYRPVRDLEQILDALARREQDRHFLLRHRTAVQGRYQANPVIAEGSITRRVVVRRGEARFARVDEDVRLRNTHPGVPRRVGSVGGIDFDVYDRFFLLEDLLIMYLLHLRLLVRRQHARLRVVIGDQYVGALDTVFAQDVLFQRHEHPRRIYDVLIRVRRSQDGQYAVLEPALQALYTTESSAREIVVYDPLIAELGNRDISLVISRLDPIPGIRGT